MIKVAIPGTIIMDSGVKFDASEQIKTYLKDNATNVTTADGGSIITSGGMTIPVEIAYTIPNVVGACATIAERTIAQATHVGTDLSIVPNLFYFDLKETSVADNYSLDLSTLRFASCVVVPETTTTAVTSESGTTSQQSVTNYVIVMLHIFAEPQIRLSNSSNASIIAKLVNSSAQLYGL